MVDKIAQPSFSYLLRLWAENDRGEWVWRASLRHISANDPVCQELKFANPEAAIAYLHTLIDQSEKENK